MELTLSGLRAEIAENKVTIALKMEYIKIIFRFLLIIKFLHLYSLYKYHLLSKTAKIIFPLILKNLETLEQFFRS